jgi:hypothetical protein
MVHGGGDTFQFDGYRAKNLVPHRQFREDHTSLKGNCPPPPSSSKLASDVIPYMCVVIPLALARGITTHNCMALSPEGFFGMETTTQTMF